jgi:hypothetical protein
LTVTFTRVAASTPAKPAIDDVWRPRGGYLDPKTGRFLGEDPIAATGDVDARAIPAQPEELEPAQPQPSSSDLVSYLERLSKLHETGALTDDEYEAAKAKLLAD